MGVADRNTEEEKESKEEEDGGLHWTLEMMGPGARGQSR